MRALVHGWRHTRSSLVGIDIIEAADIVAEGSLRSSSIMPEDPAQPGHRQRVGGQSRLSRPHVYTILLWPPADPSGLPGAQARRLSVRPPRRRWSAATTARLYKDEALSGNPQKCPLKIGVRCEPPSFAKSPFSGHDARDVQPKRLQLCRRRNGCTCAMGVSRG